MAVTISNNFNTFKVFCRMKTYVRHKNDPNVYKPIVYF